MPRKMSARHGGSRLLRAAPVGRSRVLADLDSEDEPEELDERAGRIRDTGLEMLGRELSQPDRRRHPGEEVRGGRTPLLPVEGGY